MNKLSSRVVLITGCSAGIGLALALDLVSRADPAPLLVHATSRYLVRNSPLEQAMSSLRVDRRERIFLHSMDVTNEAEVQTVVGKIISQHGKIDILINNAGICLAGYSETTELDEIRRQFDVNYFGAIRMLQAVLPSMRKARSGQIISISSASGIRSTSGLGFYGGSKAALAAMHEAEAPLLAEFGINMTLVEAGIIATNTAHMSDRFGSRKEYKDDSVSFLDVADAYAHTLTVAHGMFQRAVPHEGWKVEDFCNLMYDLIRKFVTGVETPQRLQTPGQATRIARDVWVDPDRKIHFEKESQSVAFYLTRDPNALDGPDDDD